MSNINGPYMQSKNKTSKMMAHLIIALIPIILFSFYKNGVIPYYYNKVNLFGLYYPIIMVLITSLSTLVFEMIYAKVVLKEKDLKTFVSNSYSIIPGIFLGLILPINTPISILILGSFVASIVAKMLFGGFGENIFNPALVGRLFIISTYAIVITGNGGYLNNYEVDTITSATPLSNVQMVTGIGSYDALVEPYGTLLDFFIGTIPGAVGETSALLCIVAFVYLTITKTIKWRIPVLYISTVFVMTFIIGALNGQGLWYPLFQIFSGGLMFGAVFMATDPVTSPTTSVGQTLYGLMLGLLTVVFRYLTPYPEGVLTSILTMNMLVFVLDKIGFKSRFNIKKCLIPLFAILSFIMVLPFSIALKYQVNTDTKDPNFTIISSNKSGDDVIYTVVEKGYVGDIKAEIIINNSKIIKFDILEQNESFYQKVMDADYINKLMKEQKNIENVDTVSGATITSTAIKKMVINTLEDYGDNYE